MKERAGMFDKIYSMVRKVPKGKVVTYGFIATMVSTPRAARIVGYALHQLPGDESRVPWWRVVNREGLLTSCTVHVARRQAKQLRKEEVVVARRDGAWVVNLRDYLWRPNLMRR